MPKTKSKRQPYPSDLTDAEWALIEPLLPPPAQCGHPRTVDLREVMNALIYMARTGCQWRHLPHDFPPWSTVHTYFRKWRMSGDWERINTQLRQQVRLKFGRYKDPSVALIDTQSARTTEKGGPVDMMQAKR